MSVHHNRTKASPRSPQSRRIIFTRFSPSEAAHFDNTDSLLKKKKEKPGRGNYESNSVILSAACKKGMHTACTAKKCQCSCRHF